ncbi:MAG: molecular chaperone TorD family protein [Acidobacteriia bacterium]|nr:molecular chaperone TorD family protein [Terriglobia bacterium]
MTAPAVLNERELHLAKEAAEWRLISLLFDCPGPQWRVQVTALMNEVADAELQSAARDALEEAGEGLFHYAFGPGGPAPAREATYHQTVQLGYLMSELQAYYNAFAFQPVTAEAPDHVSVETGFIAYLKMKEAYALTCQDGERAATASESAQRFIEDHLTNLAQPLAERLEGSGIGYLATASAALLRRVGSPRVAPSPLPILQEEQQENDVACGDSSCE